MQTRIVFEIPRGGDGPFCVGGRLRLGCRAIELGQSYGRAPMQPELRLARCFVEIPPKADGGAAMPALWPIVLTASHLVLAADRVPDLNIEPSCHAASTAGLSVDRNMDSCKRDENQARQKLEQEWSGFTPAERARCTSLSHRGGSPSYVELLTCLELAKQAKSLPDHDQVKGGIAR
jgi:hypothetical protein